MDHDCYGDEMGLTRTLLVAGAGAALAYFLDPVSGKERRTKLREYWDERSQGAAEVVETGEDVAPTIVVNKQPATKRPVS
jgi:hypothetical protein